MQLSARIAYRNAALCALKVAVRSSLRAGDSGTLLSTHIGSRHAALYQHWVAERCALHTSDSGTHRSTRLGYRNVVLYAFGVAGRCSLAHRLMGAALRPLMVVCALISKHSRHKNCSRRVSVVEPTLLSMIRALNAASHAFPVL